MSIHFSFIVFSIITASKLTQTLSLTSLNFSTTLLLRRFFIHFSVVFGQAEISFVTREWEDRHLADKCKYALERDVVSGVVGDLERSAVRTHLTFDAMSVGDDLFLDSLEIEENDDNENETEKLQKNLDSLENEENQEDLLSFSSSSIVPATHTNKTDVLLRSVHFVHTLRSGLLSAYTIPREGK